MRNIYLLACVTLGCVSPDAPALSVDEQEQWNGGSNAPGETIPIEGKKDRCWSGGMCWPGGNDDGDNPQDPGDNGGEGGGGGGGPGGPAGPGDPMVIDPEPDRNRDRKSCYDWCDWSYRQCEKWCWKEYPNFIGDWNKRRVCFEDRCKKHQDPNIGYDACRNDCQRRFPERP